MPKLSSSRLLRLSPLALALLLAGCAVTREPPFFARVTTPAAESKAPAPAEPPASPSRRDDSPDRARIFTGTGQLVKGQEPGSVLPLAPVVRTTGAGGIVLNFEGADLREVIRNILGDILKESYVIDPAVGGQVTIRTSGGIPREMLPATLETLLRMNGATMVKENAVYKIVPAAAAVRGNLTPQLGNSQRPLPSGFSVQIVPLQYVGAREMARILEPFVKEATAVRVDDVRNLLILSGTERELRHLLETVDMFDINWMAGMSAGIFVLQSADVKSVVTELDRVLGNPQTSPLAGVVRVVPIERMNALLIITPQPAYLEEAKKWIARLDRGGEGAGPRFYVYNLQNQRADRLAPLLQQAFTGRSTQPAAAAQPTVAPGTPAGQIISPPTFQAQQQGQASTPAAATPQNQPAASTAAQASAARPGVVGADGVGVVRNLQVVADKDNNTILVVATPAEYAVIEAALKKLDVPSRQVMIDVTIAEVLLTEQFSLGVEWFFRNGSRQAGGLFSKGTAPGSIFTDVGTTASGAGLSPRVPGFNFLLAGPFPGGVQAAIHALESTGNSKIVANPHVAALDNQKATIKVGDRIPINQQTIVGGTTNAVTTTSQYVDTGVLLTVTPHINAGGLVTLDVSAEVSNPGAGAAVGEAPPINTRSIQTMLNVQTGQTAVLGGLIRTTKSQDSSGLPFLSRIPLLGGLFGDQSLTDNRTELVLFITPRVVESEADQRNILEDLRYRMGQLDDLFPASRNSAERSRAQ